MLDGQNFQWSFPNIALCKDKNLDVFYRTYFQPLVKYLVQSAREAEQDSMVKRLDSTRGLHRFNSDAMGAIIGTSLYMLKVFIKRAI